MTPCILHPNTPRPDGYVRIYKGFPRGKSELAHRAAYREKNGPIPPGLEVRHKCDVRNCINVDHLELGTHLQNMQDMVQRSRAGNARGIIHGCHKLTESQVLEVRVSTGTLVAVAERYGISRSQVSNIRLRKAWKHL